MTVSSGGQANATVVGAGGSALVQSGGAVSGATIAGGTLEIANGGAVLSSTINFAGGGSLLLDGTRFRGKIEGFAEPDTIDLASIAYNSATTTLAYSGTALSGTLTVTDGVHTTKLAMIGQYAQGQFGWSDDHHGGTLISGLPVDSGTHFVSVH